MPTPSDATVVLTATQLQEPMVGNNCIGIMGFTVSGVAFVNSAMSVYVEIKTDNIVYNSVASTPYLKHWNSWTLSTGEAIGLSAYSREGSQMYVYTGTPALSDPIHPSDKGLTDLDFAKPSPYPSTGYNKTFTQLQYPNTIVVTANLYGYSNSAIIGVDPPIYTKTTTATVSFSSCGGSSGGGSSSGTSTIPLWKHDSPVTCGWVVDSAATCAWVADATLPCYISDLSWDFSMTTLVDFSMATEARSFDSTGTGADN